MGVRFPSVFTTAAANPLPASAVETAFATTPPLTLPLDSAVVFLAWMVAITAGTGVTALVFRIRRGTTAAATQVSGTDTQPLAAGVSAILTGVMVDTPGPAAGLQYSLTISQTGATVASTTTDLVMFAFAL